MALVFQSPHSAYFACFAVSQTRLRFNCAFANTPSFKRLCFRSHHPKESSNMPADFVDIIIQELDEAESFRRSGGFWEKVFNLSCGPNERWVGIFDEFWDEVEQFPKRHARIENHRL